MKATSDRWFGPLLFSNCGLAFCKLMPYTNPGTDPRYLYQIEVSILCPVLNARHAEESRKRFFLTKESRSEVSQFSVKNPQTYETRNQFVPLAKEERGTAQKRLYFGFCSHCIVPGFLPGGLCSKRRNLPRTVSPPVPFHARNQLDQ